MVAIGPCLQVPLVSRPERCAAALRGEWRRDLIVAMDETDPSSFLCHYGAWRFGASDRPAICGVGALWFGGMCVDSPLF